MSNNQHHFIISVLIFGNSSSLFSMSLCCNSDTRVKAKNGLPIQDSVVGAQNKNHQQVMMAMERRNESLSAATIAVRVSIEVVIRLQHRSRSKNESNHFKGLGYNSNASMTTKNAHTGNQQSSYVSLNTLVHSKVVLCKNPNKFYF